MKYVIYKLEFQTAVHFGTGRLNETTYIFHADQLFSALYIEALKAGTADAFYEMVKKGDIVFSDAMPYVGDNYLIPKPMVYVQNDRKGSSEQKKAYKKLKYIPVDELDNFLQGKMDISHNPMDGYGFEKQRNMVQVRTDENDSKPYRVGEFYYRNGNGLYVIVGYEKETEICLFEELMEAVSYVGIGGKRASGLGKFTFIKAKKSTELERLLQNKSEINILITGALPQDSELEDALEDATYLLEKRSGFAVAPIGMQVEEEKDWQKKKDLYIFSAGSCFKKQFQGDIYDVSKGQYPIYRYAKAMFLGV